MSRFRDDAPPWSFFIPVTLAVIVGVLAADAIRYAIGTVFGGGDATHQVEAGPGDAPAAPAAAERAAAQPEPAAQAGEAAADAAAAADEAVAGDGEPPASSGLPELPDAMTARRDGDPAACVNGTVANRVAGGWEQALENGAPVPCVIVNR